MKYFFLLIMLIASSANAFRLPLTPQEIERLKKGEELERVEELKDEVFPKVTLINVIPHSPKANMDVFSDFENHRKFIPGLVKSKVVRKEGNATDVAFEMDLPAPISNSEYTTRNFVENEGNNYYLTWELVKSKQVKRTSGMVIFEEFEGKTLFTYISHITPDSSFAWAVKSRVVPDVKKNVKAVMNYLNKSAL